MTERVLNGEQEIFVSVAGQDRTYDIGKELLECANQLKSTNPFHFSPVGYSALKLLEGKKPSDYISIFIEQVRYRCNIWSMFNPPPNQIKPKIKSFIKTIKRKIAKILSFDHEYITSQQMCFNELLVNLHEFERREFEEYRMNSEKRIAELEARLCDLESMSGKVVNKL